MAAAWIVLALALHGFAAESAPRAVSKTAYLTFDDGPTLRVTPKILSVLERYAVPATFFVVGKNASKHPAIMRRIVASGHAVGNHSWDHDVRTIYRSPRTFLDSLARADRAIQAACGLRTALMRPPGWPTRRFRPAIRRAVCQAGYFVCGYNVNVSDTYARSVDPRLMLENVVRLTRGGKVARAVVLFHDTTDKDTTVDVLPDVIEYLSRNGYEFRALHADEIARSAPID